MANFTMTKPLKIGNVYFWTEPKMGFGLSVNYIPLRMGFEPFIIGQVFWIWFFISFVDPLGRKS